MIPYNPVSLAKLREYEREAEEARSAAAAAAAAPAGAADEEEPQFSEIYFGYASNLSWQTMKQRCPGSLYTGLARLDGWKWAINSTRYANIIQSPGDVVYGSLSFLSARDEAALDTSEGVPDVYQKQHVTVTRLNSDGSDMVDAAGKPQTAAVMTYVDSRRTETGCQIEPDYIILVNKAIRDGVAGGVPQAYIDKYLRPYTPEPTDGEQVTMVRTWKKYDLKTPRAPVRAD